MIDTVLNDRYYIEEEIGRGGMGVVYCARDMHSGRQVAVKVLSESSFASTGKGRMHTEVLVAARLKHPHIVEVYDSGILGERPYIVMEYVKGVSLRGHVSMPLGEILSISSQICEALSHAHAAGVIHRDLKPENILLTGTCEIKLMDFGLARVVGERSLTEEGTITGTFLYLAPELLMGQSPTPQSDLYALGLILYELVSERHPFTGDNLMAIISQHMHAPVVPPSTYNPEIPPALDVLILQLLSKQPEERPASAEAVNQELLRLASHEGDREVEPATYYRVSILDRLVRGRLVGRTDEMGEIQALWTRAAAGEGSVLLVSGEPGIGKTRMLREASTLAEVTKGFALLGECYLEGGPPYAPFAQMLGQVFMDRQRAPLTLPPVVLADLVTIAPSLLAVFPNIQPNPTLDPQAEQQRLFDSVGLFISVLASQNPVLLTIDDAHWADRGTLLLARHLARLSRRMRVLILLSYREVELEERRALIDVLADLHRERLAMRIKLSSLTIEQTRELLGVMFDMTSSEVPSDFLGNLYRETEGNPFFLEEVCKALVEEGKIYRHEGRWHYVSMESIEIPQSARVAVQTRVGKLTEEAQEVLRLASVIGREFDFELLRQVVEMDEDALIEVLESAEQAQLISEVRSKRLLTPDTARKNKSAISFAFAHALIPSTLHETMNSLRRQRLHRKVAAALEELHPDDFETLAYHWENAGNEELAIKYHLQAGHRAREVYAHQDAIQFYTEALSLMPESHPDRYGTLAARAAVYDFTAQRSKQLADVQALLAMSEQGDDLPNQVDSLISLANLYNEIDPGKAREIADKALDLARKMGDGPREGFALRALGINANVLFDRVLSQTALEASVACFRFSGMLNEAATSLSYLAMAFGSGGRQAEQQRALEEALNLDREVGDRRQEGVILRRLAGVYNLRELYEVGQSYAEESLKIFRALGDLANECHALNTLGTSLAGQGALEEAEAAYRRSLQIAEETGSSPAIWNAVFNLVWGCFAKQGKLEAGLTFFDEYLKKGQQLNDVFLTIRLEATKAVLLMLLGEYRRALDIKEAGLARPSVMQSRTSLTADLAFIGRLQLELGQLDRARGSLETALKQGEENEQPLEIVDALVNLVILAMVEQGEAGLCAAVPLIQKAWGLADQAGSREWITTVASLAAQGELAQNQASQALGWSQRAIEAVEQGGEFLTNQQMIFLTHYRVLTAVGRPGEARHFLQRAHEWVMHVLGQTQDEGLRRSWLENVRENHAILAEWQRIAS